MLLWPAGVLSPELCFSYLNSFCLIKLPKHSCAFPFLFLVLLLPSLYLYIFVYLAQKRGLLPPFLLVIALEVGP